MTAAVEPARGGDPTSDPFHVVVEAAPDGIVIVDGDGVVTLVNARVEEMFGYSRGEIVGRPIEVLLPEQVRERHVDDRATYARSARVRPMGTGLDLQARRKDGSTFPVDVSLSPLREHTSDVIALVRDITDRAEAERRLAYLASIVESSDDAIFSQDETGAITSWNRSAERLFGFRADEVIGRVVQHVLGGETAAWEEVLDRALAGERVDHANVEVRRKDGGVVHVSLTKSPIKDARGNLVGVSAIVRDISEQKLALETLSAAAAQLREGEALAHVGAWTWDVTSGVVQWSEELHRIAGRAPSEFEGTIASHLDAIHRDDRDRVATAMRQATVDADLFEDEHRMVRPDGQLRWVYARATPVRSSAGVVIGLRGICQDVTERREAEDAMRTAYERERAAAEELRNADRLKDEFLSTVSHELRTPLTAIIGFADLLRSDPATDQGLIEPVIRNSEEMHRMIERLLDLTRIQAGRVDVNPIALDIAQHLRRFVAAQEDVFTRHTITLDTPDGCRVWSDPEALDRILVNLLGNAVTYAPAGSTITVSARRSDDAVVVSVTDQGPGVPPDERTKVFERFYQAAGQPAGRRGTGIGLAIVRRYVELGGGQVWCDAAPNGGAVFAFTLPVAEGSR